MAPINQRIHGLYALCDNSLCPHRPLPWLAEQLLLGGASIIQLRAKGRDATTTQQRRQAARTITQLKQRFTFCWIINDDPYLARELGADGVHIGQDDPSIQECRRLLGPSKLIGYSAHSLAEAIAADQAGADYVALGAIFPSPTKGPDHPVQGLATLKKVCSAITAPVVAIGGITHHNIQDIFSHGAAAAAMISALTTAPNVICATRQMLAAMKSP